MARREERITQRLADARLARAASDAEAERYRALQQEIAEERDAVFETARAESEELRRKLDDSVREEAEEKRRAWQEVLAAEQIDFAKEFQTRVAREIVDVAGRVLREFADTDTDTQVAERFIERLEALEPVDRERLERGVRSADKPALVESRTALPSALRARITRTIHHAVSRAIDVEYTTTSSMLLGMRLTIGNQIVEWSVDRHFDRLETAIVEAIENAADAAAEAR